MISDLRVLRVNVKLLRYSTQATYLFQKIGNSHVREWSKFVEDLQHFSVTIEQNLWAEITAEKRPGNGVEFSFLKYLMLTFCWPTFVRSKWYKNVKPAFSLLSPPFSYRQFVKETRHEKYGHDRTRSILLILQQLLPTICRGNEKGQWNKIRKK